MSNDNQGAQGSDAGWENTQSNKSFNKNERYEGKYDSEVKANIEDRNKKELKKKNLSIWVRPIKSILHLWLLT